MTSSCSDVVTERPLISIEYELMGVSSAAELRTGLAHPARRGNLRRGLRRATRRGDPGAPSPQPNERAAPHREARQRLREAAHDGGGDLDAQAPLGRRLPTAPPFRETEPPHRAAVAIGCLPVEPAAFDVVERLRETGQERRPFAIDRGIACPRSSEE